jgi:hypothetical protein
MMMLHTLQGRPMEPGRTVDDYNLLDGTVVHMVSVGGGGAAAGGGEAETQRLRQALAAERAQRGEVERANAQMHSDAEAQEAALQEAQQQLRQAEQQAQQQLRQAQQAQAALAAKDARIAQLEGGGTGPRDGGGGGGGGSRRPARGRPAEAVPPRGGGAARAKCAGGTYVCKCGGGCKCLLCKQALPTSGNARECPVRAACRYDPSAPLRLWLCLCNRL